MGVGVTLSAWSFLRLPRIDQSQTVNTLGLITHSPFKESVYLKIKTKITTASLRDVDIYQHSRVEARVFSARSGIGIDAAQLGANAS